MTSPKPTDARASRSRAAGIAAARRLLIEEGLSGLTHLRVAEASGLHRATVYRHWPTVVSLLLDVTQNETATTIPPLVGDLTNDLTAVLRAIRDELVERGFGRVIAAVIERAEQDDEINAAKIVIGREGVAGIRISIDQAIGRGELPAGTDPEIGVAQLVGPLLLRRLLTGEPMPDEFIDGLVADYCAARAR